MTLQRSGRRKPWGIAAVVAATMVGGGAVGVLAAPSASAASTVSTTVDDAVSRGASHFSYTGAWSVCTGCRSDATGGSFHYTNRRGATVRLTFTGVRAVVYGPGRQRWTSSKLGDVGRLGQPVA